MNLDHTCKILFLTTILPQKQRMGSEVASQCFIDALTAIGCDVTVAGYMRVDDVFETSPNEIVVDQRYIETKKSKLNTFIWLNLSFLLRLPYSAAKYYSKLYKNCVRECFKKNDYDIVIIDHPQLGWLQKIVKAASKERKYRLIAIAHNVEHEIYFNNANSASNLASKWIYQREAFLVKKMEDALAAQAEQVWALTEYDATYFNKLGASVEAIPFALPPGLSTRPQADCPDKIFDIGLIGSWAWKPNEEGLCWFLEEVYPYLPKDFNVQVAGRGAEWLTEQYPDIHYVGFVPDAQVFMAQARVVAIPTLSGGGIQIKTLDAIASGSKIVATPIALRGITTPPKTVHIAQEPKDFADLLSVAIAEASTQVTSPEPLNWLKNRQEEFIVEIKNALTVVHTKL
ncbi:MAG: glycosyltransferase [Verrucomicrobiota bacterium]